MTAPPLYRVLAMVAERQRLELGHSMAKVDDLAGTQDGYYGHAIYPDTPNGRQARWETMDLIFEALFGKGYTITATPANGASLGAASLDKGASTNALANRHWRHSAHFSALGVLGAKARNEKLSKAERIKIARRGGRMWKKICAAKRKDEAHRAANAAKRKTP